MPVLGKGFRFEKDTTIRGFYTIQLVVRRCAGIRRHWRYVQVEECESKSVNESGKTIKRLMDMGIEDTIIKVVRDENNMLLGKLEDVINHAISGIKKGYGDIFLPDYVPVRKATELLGCTYKELLKRLNAINAKPEKIGTRNCITRDELLKIMN